VAGTEARVEQDGEIIETTGGVLPEKTEELADAHD